MAVNVQQLPYIAPKKHRKPETRKFVVKWLEGTSVNFRWYCRDSDAVAFLNHLRDQRIPARLIMSKM
jgi:hypothetical protein